MSRIVMSAIIAAMAACPAMAVDYTWTGGGGSDNWNTPANWGGTAPTPANTNNVIFSGTTRLTPNQNLGTADFFSLQFSSTAGNFTIGGNALRLGDYSSNQLLVLSNSAPNASQTINNPIAFNAVAPAIDLTSTGTLTLGGLLTNGTGSAVTEMRILNGTLIPTNSANSFGGGVAMYGSATLVVSQMADIGVTSQIGTGSKIRLGNGGGNGTFLYTGDTTSSNRQFQFGSNPTGSTAIGAGTITADGTGPITFSNATFNVSPGTTVNQPRTVTLSGTNTGDNTISGAIIDNDADAPIAITKSGAGTWVLAGNSTYSGTTNVSGGTLVISHGNALGGAAAGTVFANVTTLGVQGNITSAEPLTIHGNGAVSGTGAIHNISGNNELSGAVTLNFNSMVRATSGTLTLSNRVQESGGSRNFRKTGAGTVVLSGNNTYSGTTTAEQGTLVIGHANALGGTAVGTVVSNNATLSLQGNITTAEPITIQGVGVGGSGGLVNISGANTLSGPVTLAANATVGATSGTLTLSNAVGGDFSLTTAGDGTVVLGGANTYTGDTIVSAGVLRLGANQSMSGTNAITVSSGTLDTAGFAMSMFSPNLQGLTLGGGAAGSQAVVTTSSGTISITSNQPDIEYVATNNPLGATISGNLQLTSTSAATAFTVGDSSAAVDDLTISAVIGGSLNSAYKDSAGTLVLSGQNTFAASAFQVREGAVVLAADAPASGPGSLGNNAVDVQVGHISSGGEASLLLREGVSIARSVAIVTNTSNPLGFTRTLGGQNTSGTATFSGGITVATNALLSAAAGGTTVFSGNISNRTTNFQGGAGAKITKIGAGTVVLSGSNSTTLPWSVEAGTLLVNGTNAGSGGTTVDAGALLGGSGRINGLVTVNGTLSPGNSPGILTLSSLVLTSTATTLMEINELSRGSQYDGINITTAGGLTYGGILSFSFGAAVPDQTTFDLFSFSGTPTGDFTSVSSTGGVYAGTWSQVSSGTWSLASGGQTLTFSTATGDIVVVPEPGTLLLAVGGGIAAIAARRLVKRFRRTPGRQLQLDG